MKKNRIYLLIVSVVLCLFAVGCKGGTDSTSDVNNVPGEEVTQIEQTQKIKLELSKTVISNMIIGDEVNLLATYEKQEGIALVWESSNADIVRVEPIDETMCKIIGMRAGNATITVTYGAETQKCEVSVSQNNVYPILYLQSGVEESVTIGRGGKLDLSGYVRFNGKRFDDVALTYTVGNSVYGSVDTSEQMFIASNQTGSTTVTITGEWRDIDSELLTKTITVNIISDIQVTLNGGAFSQINLMTVAQFREKSYQNEQAITSIDVLIDGEKTTEYTATITDSVAFDGTTSPVAFWDGNKITANAYGTAKFTISVGDDFAVSYDINVERPLLEYGKTLPWFSTLSGELPVFEIFNGLGLPKLVTAKQNGEELEVSDTNVYGVVSSRADAMSVESIEVYNDKVGFILMLETYAQVIEDANDMDFMKNQTIGGYVYLKNDVTVENWSGLGANAKFTGVFEGNGFKVTVPMRLRGVFGQLTGTVKNTWFEFTKIRNIGSYESNSLLATLADSYAIIENVYVTLDASTFVAPTSAFMLFTTVGLNTSIKNLVVDYGDLVPAIGYTYSMYGLLCQYQSGGYANNYNYENVYFISSGLKYLMHDEYGNTSRWYNVYAVNDEALMLADKENDREKDKTQYVIQGVKRYDTWQDLIDAENDLSTFDTTWWNVDAGYPAWNNGKVAYTVNGVVTDSISLINVPTSNKNSATIAITLNEKPVTFTLEIESGATDIVTIEGGKITAKENKAGSAVILAKYWIGDKPLEKRFRLEVVAQLFGEDVLWSTTAKRIYLPEGLLATGETLDEIIDLDTSLELYSVKNGYNVMLLNNSSNEIKSFRATVKGNQGTILTVTLKSSWFVVSTAGDMQAIATLDGVNTGSIIMANNITVDAWDTSSKGINFSGVFDGNGYTLTCPLRSFGIFGAKILAGGCIQNVQIVINKQLADGEPLSDLDPIISNNIYGTVQNVHIRVDCAISKRGIALFNGVNGATLKQVVVDYGTKYEAVNATYEMLLTAFGDTTQLVLDDVYFIATGTNIVDYKGRKAENDTDDATYKITGIKRYDTLQAMQSDTGKDLTDFSSIYWDTTNGAPVWRSK